MATRQARSSDPNGVNFMDEGDAPPEKREEEEQKPAKRPADGKVLPMDRKLKTMSIDDAMAYRAPAEELKKHDERRKLFVELTPEEAKEAGVVPKLYIVKKQIQLGRGVMHVGKIFSENEFDVPAILRKTEPGSIEEYARYGE